MVDQEPKALSDSRKLIDRALTSVFHYTVSRLSMGFLVGRPWQEWIKEKLNHIQNHCMKRIMIQALGMNYEHFAVYKVRRSKVEFLGQKESCTIIKGLSHIHITVFHHHCA